MIGRHYYEDRFPRLVEHRPKSSPSCPTAAPEYFATGLSRQTVGIKAHSPALAFLQIPLLRITSPELDATRTDELEAMAAEIADVCNLAIVRQDHLKPTVLARHGLARALLDLSARAMRIRIEMDQRTLRPNRVLDDVNHLRVP